MSRDEDKKNLFSLKNCKIEKTSKGTYCLNLELKEEEFELFAKRYFIQKTHFEINKANINALKYNLNPRELKILNCIIDGKTNLEIAKEINVSIHTVKVYVANLYRKMNVKNRLEAAKSVLYKNISSK